MLVEGKLRTKKWTDKSGVERYSTEIKGDELKMLGKADSAQSLEKERLKPTPEQPTTMLECLEEDIPS